VRFVVFTLVAMKIIPVWAITLCNLVSCYAIQLMHYSHFKTQSLRHLKPIKC